MSSMKEDLRDVKHSLWIHSPFFLVKLWLEVLTQWKSECPEGEDRLIMNLLDQIYDIKSMSHNLDSVTQVCYRKW